MIIRIGFWDILHYNLNKEPPTIVLVIILGPWINVDAVNMQKRLSKQAPTLTSAMLQPQNTIGVLENRIRLTLMGAQEYVAIQDSGFYSSFKEPKGSSYLNGRFLGYMVSSLLFR